MATIRHYPFMSHVRAEASAFLVVYRNGKLMRAGRGQAAWFSQQGSASLVEVPADDRSHIISITARTSDFQAISVQGVATWRAANPELLAERLDFTLNPRSGRYNAEPIAQIETLIDSLVKTAVERFMSVRSIEQALSDGLGALLTAVKEEAVHAQTPGAIGIELTGIHLSDLTPAPELVRALRQPTAEKMQQAADEATFARRAAAVEKEAAIAENETKAKIRLEEERGYLFARERDNELAQARTAADKQMVRTEGEAAARELTARSKATDLCVTAEAEANSIRMIEEARLIGERARAEITKSMPELISLAQALKEGLATANIGTLNLGQDILTQISTVLSSVMNNGKTLPDASGK